MKKEIPSGIDEMHDIYKEFFSRSGAAWTLSAYMSNMSGNAEHLYREDVVINLRMRRGVTDFGTQEERKIA